MIIVTAISICSARHIRIQILTRMFRFYLFMINVCYCNRNTSFNTDMRGNRPIKRVAHPSSCVNSPFRTSNRRSFNRIICALIGLFPNRTRVTIKVCSVFFVKDNRNPVFGPIARNSHTWFRRGSGEDVSGDRCFNNLSLVSICIIQGSEVVVGAISNFGRVTFFAITCFSNTFRSVSGLFAFVQKR